MAEQTKPIRDEATRLCKSETLSKFKLFTGFKEEELTTLLSL